MFIDATQKADVTTHTITIGVLAVPRIEFEEHEFHFLAVMGAYITVNKTVGGWISRFTSLCEPVTHCERDGDVIDRTQIKWGERCHDTNNIPSVSPVTSSIIRSEISVGKIWSNFPFYMCSKYSDNKSWLLWLEIINTQGNIRGAVFILISCPILSPQML